MDICSNQFLDVGLYREGVWLSDVGPMLALPNYMLKRGVAAFAHFAIFLFDEARFVEAVVRPDAARNDRLESMLLYKVLIDFFSVDMQARFIE